MIRINLTPPDEMENHFWWVPEVSIGISVFLISYFSVQYFIGIQRDQLTLIQTEAESIQNEIQSVSADVKRFESLTNDKTQLVSKIQSLRSISGESRIAKFKPIIFLEHFQNMRPDGLWFTGLELDSNYQFQVSGQSVDNLLIAEFMGSIKRTKSQDVYENDIRTHVYFDKVELKQIALDKTAKKAEAETSAITGLSTFQLSGTYLERAPSASNPEKPVASRKTNSRKKRI